MAKQADVELRIRSRDLSKKGIAEVTKELDALNEKLLEQRDAAKVASTSVKALADQQKQLADASATLGARRGEIEALQKQQAEIAETTKRLNEYRRELAELRRTQRAGTFLGDIDKAISNVGRAVKTTSSQLDKQRASFDKAAGKAQELGIEIEDLAGSMRRLDGLQERVAASTEEVNSAFARRETAVKQAAIAQERQAAATREATEAERRLQQEIVDSIRFEEQREEARRRARVQESRAGFEEGFAAREAREREITAEVERRNRIEREAAARGMREVIERDLAERALAARREQAMSAFANASRAQLRNPESREAVVAEQKLLQTRRQLVPVTDSLAKQTRNAAQAQSALNAQNRTALSFNQRLRGQILSIAAAYFGVFEAINVVRKAITTDIEREGTMMRLQVAADGDSRQAGKDMEYVREQADRLGQSLTPLAAQYSKFAIASTGAGQSLETTRQVFEDFSEVATVLQLSQENLDGIFKALEQSFSKGIVQAEELRGQLGDRLPGAFTKLAKSIGLSNAELTKLMENGELTADVLPLLGEFLADEVASSLPQAVNNTRAELARLKTAFDDFLVTLSRGGLGDAVRNLAIELREFFASRDGQEFAESLASSFKLLIDAIRAIISALGGPGGLITLLKVLAGITIARWAGQWAQSIGASVVALNRMRVAMVATTATARTMGAGLMSALGPIGIVLALITEAFFYFKLKADDAADAAEAQAKQLNELRTAQGRALVAAVDMADQELENATAARDSAKAEREKAAEIVKATRARLEQLKLEGKFTENAGYIKGERQTRLTPEAQAQARQLRDAEAFLASQEAAYQQELTLVAATTEARQRMGEEARSAETKALQEFAAINAELASETNKERFKSDDEYYNQVTERARKAYTDLGEVSRQYVKQSTLDQQEALQGTIGRLRAERIGLDVPTGTEEDSKAKREREKAEREAKRALEERVRLAEEAAEALKKVEKEALEASAKTVEGRLALLDFEMDEREADLLELQEKLKAAAAETSGVEAELLRRSADATGAAAARFAEGGDIRSQLTTDERQAALHDQFKKNEEELNALIDQRAAKIEYINALREAGQLTQLEAEKQARDAMLEGQDAIAAKAMELRDFLLANQGLLAGVMNVDAVLLQLDAMAIKLQTGTTAAEKFLYTWRDEISSGMADVFGTLAEGIAAVAEGTASWSDAFKAAGDAFLNFAADFLVNIGKMIVQAIILKAIQNALNGTSGGFFAAAAGAIGVAHTGAMVGAPMGSSRAVSPLAFIGAPRYHNGGFPGLKSGEVPIIAQTGEEVLSRTDPRNAMNGGGAAGKSPDIKIVNAIDSASVVTEAMNRRDGQQSVVNMIQARKAEIKQILGVG